MYDHLKQIVLDVFNDLVIYSKERVNNMKQFISYMVTGAKNISLFTRDIVTEVIAIITGTGEENLVPLTRAGTTLYSVQILQ